MPQHGKTLDAEVDKRGAKTLLYLTWARQDAPDTRAALTKAYREPARDTNATVAVVGVAWEGETPTVPLDGEGWAGASPPQYSLRPDL
jgi:hypothetical protein